MYTNETLFMLEDSYVAGAFINIKELVIFDSFNIIMCKGSSVKNFAGGGQIFNSRTRAFY